MPRGGKRPGSGRPRLGNSYAKARTIRVNEETWQQIKTKAKQAGLTTTEYIIIKASQD